jgi:DmsE family decaheme c-type cytochrome
MGFWGSAFLLLGAIGVSARSAPASESQSAALSPWPGLALPRAAFADQTPTQPAAAPSGYAGSDACAVCHSDVAEGLASMQHGRAANPRSPAAGQGCESCHGPGQAHIDDDAKGNIRKFGEIPAAARSDVCLTCHNRGDHVAWQGSTHEARNLACTTCHSVHAPQSFEKQLVRATEKELCATCHRVQVSKTDRAVAHMPVREGKLSCSSCHNPHGSITNVKALRVGSSVSELCVSCHQEMRAPVIWEHAPVKENCATCHDPHGSSNDRMLTVRMPMLCQRCHVATRHPSSIYDNNAITVNKSNRMFGRSCVNCHSNVHGSNHPSGQFFMR